MKIWYDACTGKQVRYGAAITKRLSEKGHEIVFTTREHPDTIPLAKYLGINFKTVGKYDPTSRYSRLRESLLRQVELCKMFKENPPDVAISHGSVELCRVAYGLGAFIISTHDAPHAEAVNRLTLPLVDVLVVSKAIPDSHLHKYAVKKIVKFDGVDEVAWIKDFRPTVKYDYGHPLIVVRQLETKAAYAEGVEDPTLKLAEKLSECGKVVFLSRYERKPRKNLIVPEGFVDSASLVAQADLVVSVGGTLAREAALQGTPSIVIPVLGRSFVNDYLYRKGFPLFTVKPEEVIEHAKKLLGKKSDVKSLLSELENPVDIIERILKGDK
ncbi:hypothetical protein DRO54_02110 [Candidatus Bathyarchaeota archaeon]|nr:MAG: hypothetical protein DRO54_02110 [Candidatus Bathyarchaeota archaeon]